MMAFPKLLYDVEGYKYDSIMQRFSRLVQFLSKLKLLNVECADDKQEWELKYMALPWAGHF